MILELIDAKNFISRQYELYKMEFSDTNNRKYLDVMNELSKTLDTIRNVDSLIVSLCEDKRSLMEENEKLKRVCSI